MLWFMSLALFEFWLNIRIKLLNLYKYWYYNIYHLNLDIKWLYFFIYMIMKIKNIVFKIFFFYNIKICFIYSSLWDMVNEHIILISSTKLDLFSINLFSFIFWKIFGLHFRDITDYFILLLLLNILLYYKIILLLNIKLCHLWS